MAEGIRRCKCGGWVHRARICQVCKILERRHVPAGDATDEQELQPVNT